MKEIRISAVSYLNTLPFVYGIKNSGLLEGFRLMLDVPSECSRKFHSGEADIALVPVAGLYQTNSFRLLPDFCIGSNKRVKTVGLFSRTPLPEIKRIYLDNHSLTSAILAKIFARYHWKINPEWNELNTNEATGRASVESLVAIGDKTFPLFREYKHIYDFAEEWKTLTGLPAVFACWVAHKDIEEEKISLFTKALHWGVENKIKACKTFKSNLLTQIELINYLSNNIDFNFDEGKQQSFRLFHEYMSKL